MKPVNMTDAERLEAIHAASLEQGKTLRQLIAQGKTMTHEAWVCLVKACLADALWIRDNSKHLMAVDPACKREPASNTGREL